MHNIPSKLPASKKNPPFKFVYLTTTPKKKKARQLLGVPIIRRCIKPQPVRNEFTHQGKRFRLLKHWNYKVGTLRRPDMAEKKTPQWRICRRRCTKWPNLHNFLSPTSTTTLATKLTTVANFSPAFSDFCPEQARSAVRKHPTSTTGYGWSIDTSLLISILTYCKWKDIRHQQPVILTVFQIVKSTSVSRWFLAFTACKPGGDAKSAPSTEKRLPEQLKQNWWWVVTLNSWNWW